MSKGHVLIVEPDVVLARLYKDFSTQAGYDALAVRTAQAAVTAADAQRPDLVILEMQLPHHGGAAFLYEFRSYADWQDIPIIVHSSLSPRALEQYADALEELGVRQQLYKPQTSLQHLATVVARHFAVPA